MSIVEHNIEFAKTWKEAPFNFTDWSFWLSIKADPDKKWTKTYLQSVLSKDISRVKGGDRSTIYPTDRMRKEEFKRIFDKMTSEEKDKLRKYAPSSYDQNIIYLYPPYLQDTLNIFINMFSIDFVPDPHNDKAEYGLWLKELAELKKVGGRGIQNSLLRAKMDYDKKYDFEITRPRQAIKILATAKKNMEDEWDNIHVPEDDTKKMLSKSSLNELIELE